jgi:HlyD family secretion protein
MSDITYGKYLQCYIPALDTHTMLEVTYIASEANFATWSATRARGGFDIRTFEIHARPLDNKNTLLPGMSIIINDIM